MTYDWKRRWARWEVLGFCSYLVDKLESNKENSEGRTVRDEYSKMYSMFVCFEIVILIIVGTYSTCLRGKNLALTHDSLHQMSKIILCWHPTSCEIARGLFE